MKLLVSLSLLWSVLFQSGPIEDIRDAYANASKSTAQTKEFIHLAASASGHDPITLGYKAASDIMFAKITTEKNKRKSYVTKGAKSLEQLISTHPNHAELRLIRLSIQENLPKIVGYHKNQKEDKLFLLKNYDKQTPSLKSNIKKFSATSKNFSDAERAQLK